jgi:hypothetical protein
MLKLKPIINKRGYVDDAISLVSTIIVLLLIFGFSLVVAGSMTGSKYLFKGDAVPRLNLEKESPVLTTKDVITEKIISQINSDNIETQQRA